MRRPQSYSRSPAPPTSHHPPSQDPDAPHSRQPPVPSRMQATHRPEHCDEADETSSPPTRRDRTNGIHVDALVCGANALDRDSAGLCGHSSNRGCDGRSPAGTHREGGDESCQALPMRAAHFFPQSARGPIPEVWFGDAVLACLCAVTRLLWLKSCCIAAISVSAPCES